MLRYFRTAKVCEVERNFFRGAEVKLLALGLIHKVAGLDQLVKVALKLSYLENEKTDKLIKWLVANYAILILVENCVLVQEITSFLVVKFCVLVELPQVFKYHVCTTLLGFFQKLQRLH